MAKPKKTPEIKTEIKIEGEKHPLQQMLEDGTLPELISVGCVNLDPNRLHKWASFVLKTKGTEIVSIEAVSEPDMRPHAVDGARTKFVTHFMDQIE